MGMSEQQTDFANANAAQITRALAEQPCPKCDGRGTHIESFPAGRDDVDCPTQGLAFAWASEDCQVFWATSTAGFLFGGKSVPTDWLAAGWKASDIHGDKCHCNGSGRVPKALGLEELLERFPMALRPPIEGCCPYHAGWQAGLSPHPSETPTLAALRALAKALLR